MQKYFLILFICEPYSRTKQETGTGKIRKLVSSVLQKIKHFTVMFHISWRKEKQIPYCGRILLLKAVFSAKMSKCLLGHSHCSTREKKNSQHLHWAAVAKVENINNGLNLWTHGLLHEVNHKLQVLLLTIPAVRMQVFLTLSLKNSSWVLWKSQTKNRN